MGKALCLEGGDIPKGRKRHEALGLRKTKHRALLINPNFMSINVASTNKARKSQKGIKLSVDKMNPLHLEHKHRQLQEQRRAVEQEMLEIERLNFELEKRIHAFEQKTMEIEQQIKAIQGQHMSTISDTDMFEPILHSLDNFIMMYDRNTINEIFFEVANIQNYAMVGNMDYAENHAEDNSKYLLDLAQMRYLFTKIYDLIEESNWKRSK